MSTQSASVKPFLKLIFCSVEPLENYFHRHVSQDVKKGLAKCFVLINEQQSRIVGYYTLSALSIPITDIPQERISKGIPYPNISAVLVGRLAIDTNFQNQGYGKFLIADATKACCKVA
uniref:N-acetyltransferase domain-containing protein n=1 Tax=Histophilus somni (strain 129Pt) TaxID=205914 RepID=Q0I507_HISS1